MSYYLPKRNAPAEHYVSDRTKRQNRHRDVTVPIIKKSRRSDRSGRVWLRS